MLQDTSRYAAGSSWKPSHAALVGHFIKSNILDNRTPLFHLKSLRCVQEVYSHRKALYASEGTFPLLSDCAKRGRVSYCALRQETHPCQSKFTSTTMTQR